MLLRKLKVLAAEIHTHRGLWQGREGMSSRTSLRAKLGVCSRSDLAGKAEQEPSPLSPPSVHPALPSIIMIHIYTQASRDCKARSGKYQWYLQQHKGIQNANLKYEMYIRIISSNKCAPIQAGENYFF